MRKFKFDKLVRDKIVELQQQDGGEVDYKILSDKEFLRALQRKLHEEASEINVEDKGTLISELADVQEVIDCLIKAIGKSKADILVAQTEKNKKAGSFSKKMYVNTVSVQDGNAWIKYYLDNAQRYPEIQA